MIDPLKYKPRGDKKNSDFFEEYRIKIFERRNSSGLTDLLGDMGAIVVQVQTGDALPFLKELYLMTPYRFKASYLSKTHKIFCLTNYFCDHHKLKAPVYFLLEPLNPMFKDDISRINKIYPNAREKFNARYVGEIFNTKDKEETKKILISHDFRFQDPARTPNKFYCNPNIEFTSMSDLTYNSVGYSDKDLKDFDGLALGEPFGLTKQEKDDLEKMHEFSKKTKLIDLIKGIDHLATRVLAGEREDAILEFLCLSPYYFWGAYNIHDMNSSTNVNRVTHGDDIRSPAKVFTANNTPFMINSFEKLPMPTEDFVRNYGRRMHHIAMEITDGDHSSGMKNIDYVINTLRDEGHIPFLAQIFGACTDVPDLKQIFSKHSSFSLLITEYVERCHGFDGFFTKDNVAALTEAAGLDETIQKPKDKGHGVIGD